MTENNENPSADDVLKTLGCDTFWKICSELRVFSSIYIRLSLHEKIKRMVFRIQKKALHWMVRNTYNLVRWMSRMGTGTFRGSSSSTPVLALSINLFKCISCACMDHICYFSQYSNLAQFFYTMIECVPLMYMCMNDTLYMRNVANFKNLLALIKKRKNTIAHINRSSPPMALTVSMCSKSIKVLK